MSDLESLFLLEVLVDCVVFSSEEAKKLRETCVQFRFLQFPPFEVCEEDFAPSGAGYDSSDVPFNAGKSLLFSMSQFKAGQNINLDVSITKSDEQGRKQLIGKTAVPLGSSFTNLFLVSSKRQLNEPIAKTIRDTFIVFNNQNVETGKIGLLVRLSCFGSAIVTQFEVNDPDEQTYKFNNESYNKKDKKMLGEHFDIREMNRETYNQPSANAWPPNYPQYSAMRYPPQMQQQPDRFPPQMGYPLQSQTAGEGCSPISKYQNYLLQQYCQNKKSESQKMKGVGSVPNCVCFPASAAQVLPRPISPPKPVFRRCYVLGEGMGPSPRTGDLFSWVSPSKTEKDKEREELLGGPKISWEISSRRAPQKGDIIKIEPETLNDKKPVDGGEKKLGKRGQKNNKTENKDAAKVVRTRVVFEDDKKDDKKSAIKGAAKPDAKKKAKGTTDSSPADAKKKK